MLTASLLVLFAQTPADDAIIVAAKDLTAGELITFDLISQRKMPPALATASAIKAKDASYAVNQVVVVDVRAGDPLWWGFLLSGRTPIPPSPGTTAADAECRKGLAARGLPLFAASSAAALRTRLGGSGAPVASPRVAALTRALVEGSVITDADLTELELPKPNQSPAWVPAADRKLLVGRKLPFAMTQGEPVPLAIAADLAPMERLFSCIRAVGPPIEKAMAAARKQAAAQVIKTAAATGAGPPSPAPDVAGGDVVVVARDVEEGKVLTRDDLTTARLPDGLRTDSYVPAAHLDRLVGRRSASPLMAKDPLLWQLLDEAAVRTLPGCLIEASKAADRAAAEAAPAAVAAQLDAKEKR